MLEREQTVAYSWEDLDALPPEIRLREIIDGELFENPSPDWWHNRLALRIVALLDAHGEGIGQANLAPLDVRLSRRDVVQPDVVFMLGEAPGKLASDGRIDTPPAIIVEIVSANSARGDRIRKFALYERSGVAEYWLVDPRSRALEIHRLEDGLYLPVSPDERGAVRSSVLPGLAVDPERLFAGMP